MKNGSETVSRKLLSVPFLIAIVVALSIGTAVALVSRHGGSEAVKSGGIAEEPESEIPATPKTVFAQGASATGEAWSAVTYETRGGSVCIDTKWEGVAGDKVRVPVSGGSCHTPLRDRAEMGIFTSYGRDEFLVSGALAKSADSAPSARDVSITLSSGEVQTFTATPDGLLAGVVHGIPVSYSYTSNVTDGVETGEFPAPSALIDGKLPPGHTAG